MLPLGVQRCKNSKDATFLMHGGFSMQKSFTRAVRSTSAGSLETTDDQKFLRYCWYILVVLK